MERIGLGTHLLVFVAMVVNLWVGGDFIEAWAGHLSRAAFEIVLITGYLVLVLGFGVRGGRNDDRRDDRR